MWVKAPVCASVLESVCAYEWVIKGKRQRKREGSEPLFSTCEVDLYRQAGRILHIYSTLHLQSVFKVFVSASECAYTYTCAFVTFLSCLFYQHASAGCACTLVCVCVCAFSAWMCKRLPGEARASPSSSVLTSSLSARSLHLPPTTCSLRVMKVTHVGVIENELARICACVCVSAGVCTCSLQ